jgi:acyl-homoserine lactone acylase PvdQ
MQSYLRTKARNYKAYRETMELKANSSNNTIYADADGTIAYFHGNFIPKRDTRFDWTQPTDGSNPATEWGPLHNINETPTLLNPKSGWLYNANNSPWSAAGPQSPKKSDFPAYVDSNMETARGLHAIRVLQDKKDFTLDTLIAAAYDSYLPWFEKTIPALAKAWDDLPASNPLRSQTAEQVKALRAWDFRWSTTSIPTSVAVFWGEEIRSRFTTKARAAKISVEDYVASRAPSNVLIEALVVASSKLESDFGTWHTPWGEVNRFQRLTGDLVQPFNDAKPSLPVGFTSGIWGSLASFGARSYPGTKKWYGTSGNSFVAVVEFGDRVRAKAISAGGESGNPSSPHFNDQALRYTTGSLRDVYFYRDQLKGHTEREYHPGQ